MAKLHLGMSPCAPSFRSARVARSFYCVQHVCMVLPRLVNRMSARNKPFRGWGPRLKALREGLKISLQDVERYSRQFAQLVGNKSFVIPPSSLSDIEKQKALPNIYKLISLSAVYRVRFPELLLNFGADLDDITKFQKKFPLPQPALLSLDIYHPNDTINFPVKCDPRIDLRQSTVLSYFVQSWGEVPVGALLQMNLRKHLWGLIGTDDLTLHPFISPGTLVQIDQRYKKIERSGWESDFDRPIYFLRLRDGYACGWCAVADGILSIVPFSPMRRSTRQFRYPDVEVVGRVTAAHVTLVPFCRRSDRKH